MKAREKSHSPYSKFAVGAALLTRSGAVFTGCNVENKSFRLTMCAEQSAVAAAVSAGDREFVRIAVVTALARPAPPCGACRQTLAEFNKNMEVVLANTSGVYEVITLGELLPQPFDDLEGTHAV